MAKVHDKYVIELAEVIKGYGNNPEVNDPFHLSKFYIFYELPNIAVSRANFLMMTPLDSKDVLTDRDIVNTYSTAYGKGYDDGKQSYEKYNIVRCNQCKYYEGVHGAIGHAPCSYWETGGVMWNWFCSQGERIGTDEK